MRPARHPPANLPGWDERWSRLVAVPEQQLAGEQRALRSWHLLDTGDRLAELGVVPVGTLLCVHGNPTWSYLWRSLATATLAAAQRGDAARAWRVVAVDQLEMGFSERTGQQRSLERRVQDLADLVEAIEFDGPIVTVGHDWGGVVSLGFAVDHPDRLAGVVLTNTAVHQPEQENIPALLQAVLAPGVLPTATATTPLFLNTTLALAHPRLPREVRAAYRAPYRTAALRHGIRDFVADIPASAEHPSRTELDRIALAATRLAVPALLAWGPRDPIFADRYLNDLIDRMPHADVHRFEGAGHLLAEDVDLATPILDWLTDRLGGTVAVPAEPAEVEAGVTAASWTPLWSRLDERADDDEPAVVDLGGGRVRSVSWRLLARRVAEIASGLVDAGVRPGDRVSLLVPPGVDLTAVVYACLRIGAIVVVADAGLGLAGLGRAVRGARPAHLIGALPGLSVARALGWPGRRFSVTTLPAVTRAALGVTASLSELARRGRQRGVALPPVPDADDVAAVLFTSGSTGPAKGVVYTHRQLSALRDALATNFDIGADTGLVAGFAPFALLGPALGARSVSPDMDVTKPRTLTAQALADAAGAVDATVVFASPAAIRNVTATADQLDVGGRSALARVQTVLSAGAPVPEQLLERLRLVLPNAKAHTPYGMTEGLLLTDVGLDEIKGAYREHDGDPRGGVCVGRPVPSAHVLIDPLTPDGLPSGEPSDRADVTGEVLVSAPHLRLGYDRLWATDRVAGSYRVEGQRWHRTGDVGRLDSGGRVWIEGRLPHVVATAEGPVTPVGVEQRLERLPEVRRAAFVGVGPRGTAQPVAIVELVGGRHRDGLASPALGTRVREAAGIEFAAVLVIGELPTDIRHNSKVDRTALAGWAERVLGGERFAAARRRR